MKGFYSIVLVLMGLVLFVGCEQPYEVGFISQAASVSPEGDRAIPVPASTPSPTWPVIPGPAPSPSSTPYVIPDATPGENAGCMPVQATLLGFSGAQVSLSGGAELSGDIYLFKNSSFTKNNNSVVKGTLFYDQATTQVNGVDSGQLAQVNLAVEKDVLDYANGLAALTPTQIRSEIISSTTLKGNGKLNVIGVAGNLAMNSYSELVLDGVASDVFVVIVLGEINIGGHASIKMGGGVLPKNVVFVNYGSGAQISLGGGGEITGTFVGVERGASVGGTGMLKGSLYGGKALNATGGGQVWEPVIFCSSR